MERELIATGIGGQGVQLAAQVMARAAVHDGLQVQMFGSYGGMMRGGNTDAALVLADGPVMAPPVIAASWLGMAMHHAYLPALVEKLRSDSILFVNSSVVERDTGFDGHTVAIAATDIAVDSAALMCASIVMLGAIAGSTGLLTLSALDAAIDESLPPYRQQHRDLNKSALAAGFDAATGIVDVPAAWPKVRAAR
jgi:Pyruvate/2-oxoacid:ferredoxin oxidoreductase gamma subunit